MRSDTLASLGRSATLSEHRRPPSSAPVLFPGKVNVLGVWVDTLNMTDCLTLIDSFLAQQRKGYISVAGVHGVMEANRSPRFKAILNCSLLTVPDGMPLVWVGRARGFHRMGRVYGPDLMLEVCAHSVSKGYTHFLCGGAPGVAQDLRDALTAKFPGLQIVGTYTPPYRPLNHDEENELEMSLAECKPDILWMGISTPKQEQFMSAYISQFETKLMIGVGAAFDIHTGRLRDAPYWMKTSGLQWLHRFWQEPRRLWKRYLVNNPRFMLAICLQSLGKHY